MPNRLQPTNPNADAAILVGDPGRALMLAQELLVDPLMSNHARGLWGYTAKTEAGRPLTIQATGMGGPSAAIVLGDLARLGVRRAIRLGACEALAPELAPGDTVVVARAIGRDGASRAIAASHRPVGATAEEAAPLGAQVIVGADAELSSRLAEAGPQVTALSSDLGPGPRAALGLPAPDGDDEAAVADLQTAALASLAQALQLPFAAVLVVERAADGETASAEMLEREMKRAGRVATQALS